jgi:hypothetical protein
VQRGWTQVALAAGAGLASLVVCSGAVMAIILLFVASTQFGWIGSSLHPIYFWLGVVAALMFAGASLSLPPLALGARERHALKATVLSGLCLCVFVLVSFSVVVTTLFLVPLISLLALVGTSAVGSLIAVQEQGQATASTTRATLIAGSGIYCASLFAYWFVIDAFWPTMDHYSIFVGMLVAASSWPVLPAIVAMLRSD